VRWVGLRDETVRRGDAQLVAMVLICVGLHVGFRRSGWL
jgi:hypothetical protein